MLCRLENGKEEDDSGEETRRRSASVLEMKEHTHSRLGEELYKAQQDLKLKDEECKKLARVHEQMSSELEDLTAKLFEEANNMVQDANIKRMNSEKFLKEANSKIEVLQAEVSALKALVITSTPSMPNYHMHPQLAESAETKKKESTFVKGHRRSTSHHNFSKDLQPVPIPVVPPVSRQEWEVDPIYFDEFRTWRQSSPSSLDPECPFLTRIIKEDVSPCLTFANKELSESVYQGIIDNTLAIEPVPEKNPFPTKCTLTGTSKICKYRIRLGDSDPWKAVSQLVRNRLATVCDFITYIRYITQGLVKSDDRAIYWEIMRLRKQMCLARLGLTS